MKRIPRILLAVFISLFILQMIGLAFLVLAPRLVQAEAKEANCWIESACNELGARWKEGNGCDAGFGKCYSPEPKINLKFGFPGLKDFYNPNKNNEGEEEFQLSLADYIGALYNYGVIIAGFLAAVMIMVGGFLWLTAAGSANQITKAKSYIGGAIVGLILALTSYLILETVNPALVRLKSLQVELVPTIAQSTFWCEDQEEMVGRVEIDEKKGELLSFEQLSEREPTYRDKKEAKCGSLYGIKNDTSGSVCTGMSCTDTDCEKKYGDNECVCVPEKNTPEFECQLGIISGSVFPPDSIPWTYNGVELNVVCANNQRSSLWGYYSLGTKDNYILYEDREDDYVLTGEKKCTKIKSTVKGYYLKVLVEDRSDWTNGLFAIDDWYAFNCDEVIKDNKKTDPNEIDWKNIKKENLMQKNKEGDFTDKTCNLNLSELSKEGR